MANEIQELKFQVGEAWKGVYSSSTAYGLANVVQDPTGLSIYRSLKSGNVGHPLSNASWWFRIIDMSSIKAESDRIAALNEAIAQDEALRVAAEELRQQHEAERVAAETQRNEAEQARISAEQARVNAESARAIAEQQRITAEESRVSAESARVQAEQARVLAETLRANAEDQRAANEQNRIAAEQQRIERAEQDHQRAESDHATYVDSLGAFDISSYHATDGVLAKYADLTAALGTNGANIPDDLRKGGMSVKFVQSSDNNYIQARLMANAFTTDITKWQVVDDIPTAGSKNLIESGGVYNLKENIGIKYQETTSTSAATWGFTTLPKKLLTIENISKDYTFKCYDGNTLLDIVLPYKTPITINLASFSNFKVFLPQTSTVETIIFSVFSDNSVYADIYEKLGQKLEAAALVPLTNSIAGNAENINKVNAKLGYYFYELSVVYTDNTIWTSATNNIVNASYKSASVDVSNYKGKGIRCRLGEAADNLQWCFIVCTSGNYKLSDFVDTVTGVGVLPLDAETLKVSYRKDEIPYPFIYLWGDDNKIKINRHFYALGDSVTYGAGSGTASTSGNVSWADRLAKKIIFNGYTKLAVSGTTCMYHSGLSRLSAQVSQIPQGGNPLIILMIGTNDIHSAGYSELGNVTDALSADYDEINDEVDFCTAFRYNIETIMRKTPNAVLLCMMPLTPQGGAYEQRGEQFRQAEREICAAFGVEVIELRKEIGITHYLPNYVVGVISDEDIANATGFLADTLHPNNAGYERIANYVCSKIQNIK